MKIDTKQLKEMTKDLNVLFVEDDPVIQLLTMKILTVFFKNVVVANNGQEGLNMFNKTVQEDLEHFDIVITDVSMPKLSGTEMATRIIDVNPAQNFIIISAHQENNYAQELGGKGFISSTSKPITLDSLKTVFYECCLHMQNSQPL